MSPLPAPCGINGDFICELVEDFAVFCCAFVECAKGEFQLHRQRSLSEIVEVQCRLVKLRSDAVDDTELIGDGCELG